MSERFDVERTLGACRLPAAEKRALLAHVLAVARERLVANPRAPVTATQRQRFEQLAARRARGEPMAYLLESQEFFSRGLRVGPAVLIPRPETERLVEVALHELAGREQVRVLELGTGSGCIAITLACERPAWQVLATDRSEAALQIAGENARRHGARVQFLVADWFGALAGRFDLVISNPPYVAADDAHLAALSWEPRSALTDESDGLGALRALVADAPVHLVPGGRLMLEHGYDQGEAVRTLMRSRGFRAVRTHRDLAGHERVCEGTWEGTGDLEDAVRAREDPGRTPEPPALASQRPRA